MGLRLLAPLLIAAAIATSPAFAGPPSASYDAMLGYLADSRIDGRALAGANGAIAANLAAGDLNMQANVRAIASGEQANAAATARQLRSNDRFDTPSHASASIGGQALDGAGGLISINQASGSGNAEVNLVTATLAAQGIREAADSSLSATSASAGGQYPMNPGASGSGSRSVAVEATALRGFGGVLQLNQVAGSGNATSNQLGLDIQGR